MSEADLNKRAIQELAKAEGNDVCADCGQKGKLRRTGKELCTAALHFLYLLPPISSTNNLSPILA